MNRYINYTALLLLLLLNACNVEDRDNDTLVDVLGESTTPVFKLQVNDFNGLNILNINAGVNDFYMFTEFEKDEQNLYSFIARFAKLSTCQTNCTEALKIEIRDARPITSNDELDVLEAVSVGDYNLIREDNVNAAGIFVEYTDPSGTVYQSGLLEQFSDSFFEISAVEDFADNENGHPTKKLNIAFNCRLKDVNSFDEIEFWDAKGAIGIAYPR